MTSDISDDFCSQIESKHDDGAGGQLDVPRLDAPLLRGLSDHRQLPEDDLSRQAEHHQQAQLLLHFLC